MPLGLGMWDWWGDKGLRPGEGTPRKPSSPGWGGEAQGEGPGPWRGRHAVSLAPLLELASLMSNAFKKKRTFKSVQRKKKPTWV